MLPRHWTPADPNGARRWGLSFGAGIVLFAVVGVFGVYMAIEAQDDAVAWNRPGAQQEREPPAAASEAIARPNQPAPPESALIAALKAQIASAHAEVAIDPDRSGLPPSSERRKRERHQGVPADRAASAAPMRPPVAKPVAKAMPAARIPLASNAPSAQPGPRPPPRAAPEQQQQQQQQQEQALDRAPEPPAAAESAGAAPAAPPQDPPAAAAEPKASPLSASGPVELAPPPPAPTPAAQPAKPPVSSTYRGASATVKPHAPALGAQTANAAHTASHTGRRLTLNSPRRPRKTEPVAARPVATLALPRLFSTLLPLAFMPIRRHAPSAPFDLSDSQRVLYRGH